MKYLEWNNIISEYFFNPGNAGKEIYLYLTKNDIINIARKYFDAETPEEIWIDFIIAIIEGIPGSKGNIISKAKFAYDKRKVTNITIGESRYEIKYPPYISYLVLFVIPLIELGDDNRRANNYYDRLNTFLKSQQISDKVGTTDFRDNQINGLWEDLSYWANIKKNGDLGLFNVVPFLNANWIYVGKVFSQCVLPPKFLNRLPELFESIGLVPDTFYDDTFLKERILKSRTDLIPKHTLDFLKKADELSNSIIQTIQRQYKKWSGESHEEIEEGTNTRKKRNYTIAPLFLQLKVNENDEEVNFSYRMYSSNDYPDDLKFGEHENLYEINGWSKTIQLEFEEGCELKDNFNKWIAKFPYREVRLFVSAGTFQLSNDFWIETDLLSKTERMYLLCKNEKLELIKEWGRTFNQGNFKQKDFGGLPDNYSLFWFRNPTQGLSNIPILTLHTEKRIEFNGGLKVNFRTYYNEFLPEIEILNSDGCEKVYLQYKDTEEKLILSKKTSLNNRWLLPKETALDTDFYIKVEDESFSGNLLAYNLVSSDNTAIKIGGLKLPKRDSFGRIVSIEQNQYCSGSNIVNANVLRQVPYTHIFRSTKIDVNRQVHKATFTNHNGNKFCSFLSLKNDLTTEEFFKAFEFFYSKEFSEHKTNSAFNLTKIKKASLNFYDYVGILDYDYETKNIVLNPPQFIFIPSEKGRKVLLIGARDSALIESMIDTAQKHNLQLEIKNQFSANERLLLPDTITIRAFNQINDNYGENCIKAFARELKVNFTADYLPQVALQDFSASIVDYEKTLQESDKNDYDWARYIFNIETLDFDKCETSTFNKEFSLVRYKLNEYTFEFKLWMENKCYQVDMNWGRFIMLKHFNKSIILFDDRNEKVAIPIKLPLPRLLAEAIILLSGLAPEYRVIEKRGYRIYTNIPGFVTANLFRKLGQTPINTTL